VDSDVDVVIEEGVVAVPAVELAKMEKANGSLSPSLAAW
jgi:hypothetical protein